MFFGFRFDGKSTYYTFFFVNVIHISRKKDISIYTYLFTFFAAKKIINISVWKPFGVNIAHLELNPSWPWHIIWKLHI